jgi:hypothetical protein
MKFWNNTACLLLLYLDFKILLISVHKISILSTSKNSVLKYLSLIICLKNSLSSILACLTCLAWIRFNVRLVPLRTWLNSFLSLIPLDFSNDIKIILRWLSFSVVIDHLYLTSGFLTLVLPSWLWTLTCTLGSWVSRLPILTFGIFLIFYSISSINS